MYMEMGVRDDKVAIMVASDCDITGLERESMLVGGLITSLPKVKCTKKKLNSMVQQ